MTIGLLAATFSALAYGLASVLQSIGVNRVGAGRWWLSPWYLSGLVLDGAAWLVSLLALRSLPLFVVQSVLASSLAVTAVAARIWLGAALRRAQVVAIVAVLVALVVLATAGGAQSAQPPPSWFAAATWAVTVALVLVTAVLARRGGSMALAVVAGLGFSVAAAAARSAHAGAGWTSLAADPLVWSIPVAGVVAMTAYALALERGAVAPATALLWVVEAVVPAAVGVSVLGDQVRTGWTPTALVAIAVAAAASVVLARSHAPAETLDALAARPQDEPRA